METGVRVIGFLSSTKRSWLPPLVLVLVIFAGLFLVTSGSIDIPFLYRR
jgi:Family of unknown function (DUF5989)